MYNLEKRPNVLQKSCNIMQEGVKSFWKDLESYKIYWHIKEPKFISIPFRKKATAGKKEPISSTITIPPFPLQTKPCLTHFSATFPPYTP